MKRFYIVIFLAFLMAAPVTQIEVKAQRANKESAVRAKKRNKKRKVRRRTRRRVNRRAHVRYASLTPYGARVAVIPSGAVVIRRSNLVYHYHSGLYYRQIEGRYVVVKPVRGIRVRSLPPKHVTVIVPRGTYYYYYGTYYQKSGEEYEVVSAPEGAIIDAIPEGYEIKEVNGTEYYVWDNVYYEEVDTDKFDTGIGYQAVDLG